MNRTIRTGLLLLVTTTGASACTSVLGGFDFDGTSGTSGTGGTSATTTTTGGTGGMTTTGGTGGMATTSSTGGMTSSSTGGACTNPTTDCPVPSTACIVASCDAQMQCTTSNAAKGDPCNEGTGVRCDGSGKCVECNDVTDCPAPPNACVIATCTAGACGTMNVAAQTLISAGQPNDCQKQECDGSGAVVSVANDVEIPDDSETCTTDKCASGVPIFTPVAAGTACSENGGKQCGDAGAPGKCIECNTATQAADCPSHVCQSNKCVAGTCNDTVKNGGESDVDCGGPNCGACIDGNVCGGNTDCLSLVCGGGICAVPTCMDGKKNGAETGKDCGNSATTGCGLCPASEGCLVATDCASGVCSNKICQAPTCADGVLNQGESDVDCGGPACAPCGFALKCGSSLDCATGYCMAGKCDVKTIASGQSSPIGIAVDSVNVYWTNYVGTVGSVMKAPINGGSATALATGQDYPRGIAVDTSTSPTTVFWTNEVEGTVKRISANGSGLTTMAISQSNPYNITASLTTVYWTNWASGTVMKLASNVAGPTAPIQVSTLPSSFPRGIALDGSSVYWVNSGNATTPSSVIGASISTGMNTVLYTGVLGMPSMEGVVADPSLGKLFMSDRANGNIVSVSNTGMNPGTFTSASQPYGIAISGTKLYWSNWTLGGSINKIATDGTGKTVIAAAQSRPAAIAVDATSIYWVNYSDGTINKANK